MNNPTYLFYDIETSGLNKAFDQVYQFAAIRTDKNLNEIERYQFLVKPTRDIVPSPQAILTHQMPISKLMAEGISELEAIQKIHALLNEPGTISLGYNTLNFDDEFLRFSFYRHLLPPYTHQYANNCSRADIYPLLILYYLYEKKAQLIWPTTTDEFGYKKVSFRLEKLNAVNQWVEGQAHDAMVDVAATVSLAKQCSNSEVWKYGLAFFNKSQALARCHTLPPAFEIQQKKYPLGLLISGRFGSDLAFQMPVLYIGTHYHYKNQMVWLCLDQAALTQTTEDYISETTQSVYLKPGEDAILLPAQDRHAIYLSVPRKKILQDNLNWLSKQPALLQKITDYHCDYKYPYVPNVDLDAALYLQAFPSDAEVQACQQFLNTSVSDKLKLLKSWQNENLQQRAIRLLARYFNDQLPTDWQQHYLEYFNKIDSGTLVDYRNEKRLTPTAALLEIEKLESVHPEPFQQFLLRDLAQYIQINFNRSLA